VKISYWSKLQLSIFVPLIFSTTVHAKLGFEDAAFPEFVTSARALAMGNAYICKVDLFMGRDSDRRKDWINNHIDFSNEDHFMEVQSEK
jgi:hypothetical protein